MDVQQQTLRLRIDNPTAVSGVVNATHAFDRAGGSIGSAASDTWQLSGRRSGVVAGHAEIRWLDGDFCLIDRSGRSFINSARQPVGRGRRARLSPGDVIRLGRYQLVADAADSPEGEAPDHSLVDGPEETLMRRDADENGPTPAEPLSELPREAGESAPTNPLFALGDDEPPEPEDVQGERNDVYRGDRDAALLLPRTEGERARMATDTPTTTPDDRSRTHISLSPLLQGLDADMAVGDSQQSRAFLEEAGATLRATMEGLLALHAQEDDRQLALRARLQPIEDNPLKLGRPYPETLDTLFGDDRSPVHLSAPAAVKESLDELRHYQAATRAAMREALGAMLDAFHPDQMLRRFHGYRRHLEPGEDEDAWAWTMYRHYHAELQSGHQRGFEQLFEEVFEQARDHHLRQQQKESML